LDVKMIIGVLMYRHVDKFAAGSYPYQADWVDEQLVHLLRGIKFRTIPKQRSTNDTSAWTVRSWQGTASNASCPNGNLDPLRVVVWKPSFQVAELLWMVNHLLAAENRPTQRTWNVVDFGGIWSQIISDLFGQKITAAADCFSLAFFSYINLYYIYISDVHVMARDLYNLFSRMLVFYLDIFSLNMIRNSTIYYYFTCY
jgi:hypothetical protein